MRNTARRAPTLPLWQPRILFSASQPVSYLPSQTTPNSGTSSLNFRSSPWKLLIEDIKLVFTLLLWVPHIFLPWRSANTYSELYPSWMNMRDLGLHVTLGLLGFIWLIVVIPVWVVAPGLLFVVFMLFYCALTVLFCVPLDYGPRLVRSRIQHVEGREVRDDENWVFVNGVAAGNHWLQANVNMISEIFGRPVIGIHNRTYGIVFDLVECLIQRCFSYATKDTRVLYNHLKRMLLDDNIRKCVVIAHSQGGIILSTALDSLFADIPSGAFEKMEIYTFACAANHFNNPIRFVPSSFRQNTPQSATNPHAPEERLIKHIEHYCNEHDFVARFGVLHFSKDKLSNRFVGKVFENKGYGGHLLNQHYLDRMFAGDNSDFLDMVPEVEGDIAAQRAQAAGEDRSGAVVEEAPRSSRSWSPVKTGPRIASAGPPEDAEELRTLGSVATPAPVTSWDFSGPVRRSAEAQRGKTVREISRLWRYKDGKSPD